MLGFVAEASPGRGRGRIFALLRKTACDGARLLAVPGRLRLRHGARLCIQFCTALQILLFEVTHVVV